MQFTYPELLWALFFLLIPIFIHLFQLRRFKKTPFTNVKILQKVVAKSRKSKTLKKWLLLLTRLLLFTALILAFAQPFMAEESAFIQKKTVIYLDDSFSMQAKKDGNSLLINAIQELIGTIPENDVFTLFTNEKVFEETTVRNIQNELLVLPYATRQLTLEEIHLKAATFFDTAEEAVQNVIIISDFQERMAEFDKDLDSTLIRNYVQLVPDAITNVSLDSAYISNENLDNVELAALLTADTETRNIPVSLFNGDTLVAKTAAVFDEKGQAMVNFTLPKDGIPKGRLEILDNGLTYDNQLYFTLDKKDKIKVLAIGPGEHRFLERIYTEDEFLFSSSNLRTLDYGVLDDQNLIVLNELEEIPTSLVGSLQAFTAAGGWLTLIPTMKGNMASYNLLTAPYSSSRYVEKVERPREITGISFDHPLYSKVFEKEVTNFQYPQVNSFYQMNSAAPSVLSFSDSSPFLLAGPGIFLFAASLSPENSNFRNSPLIVPTFYNMAANSLKLPELYTQMGSQFQVDLPIALQKDEIVKVSRNDLEFIPLQRSSTNKVRLMFGEELAMDGSYRVHKNGATIRNLSFNHPRNESVLSYMNAKDLGEDANATSIDAFYRSLEKDNRVTALWKWFVILALLFLLVEIFIQKYLP